MQPEIATNYTCDITSHLAFDLFGKFNFIFHLLST